MINPKLRCLNNIMHVSRLYVTLSAFLAPATGNPTYTEAAELSATWIKNLNMGSHDIVLNTIDAVKCDRFPSSYQFTYNSGKY